MTAGSGQGRVAGKVALVTGAASGIGAAIATMLADEGAVVVLADIDRDGVERHAAGMAMPAIVFDATDEAQWRDTVAGLMARHRRLDIAVNCAGISMPPSFPTETSFDDWRRILSVNLDGVFLGTKHALSAMEASDPVRGSIINVSSIMGIVALPDVAAYNASKGGVRLMTKSVALSCAQKGLNIRVNSIHPGFIDTPLVRRSMSRMGGGDAAQRHYDGLQPIGRLGTPQDVAFGALYLASDESSFVTGSELVIDGGYTAR